MKLLWVGKGAGAGTAGDEIYDRKMLSAIRSTGIPVSTLNPKPNSLRSRLACRMRGSAHYRDLYDSLDNRDAVRKASMSCDIAVCSWEPLDTLGSSFEC